MTLLPLNSRLGLPIVGTPPSDGDVGLLVVQSVVMQRLLVRLRAAALAPRAVLLVGEAGSGRSFLGRWLHAASDRSRKPLVELSGISHAPLDGWLQAAEKSRGGTLLVTDLDRLDGFGQRDLLLLLGKLAEMNRPPQVVATAHPSLDEGLRRGRFDRSLYDRLSVLRLDVPTLRERQDDIPTLCKLKLHEHASAQGRTVPSLSPESLLLLCEYPWPGNVRELDNVLLRAVLWSDAPMLTADQVRTFLPLEWPSNEVRLAIGTTLDEAERKFILASYHALGGNKQLTAMQLGITRRTLYQKLQRYAMGDDELAVAGANPTRRGSRRGEDRDL